MLPTMCSMVLRQHRDSPVMFTSIRLPVGGATCMAAHAWSGEFCGDGKGTTAMHHARHNTDDNNESR